MIFRNRLLNIRKLLNEPLTHFFVLGLLLFALYAMVNDDSGRSAEEVVIDQGRMSGLIATFEKTWRRPPSEDEKQSLIDAWVREEILYREGVAIGFDIDDQVIRRRVAQKMTFVADGLVPATPTDSELEEWLQANIDDYQIPANFSFKQVFIDPQRHKGDLDDVLGAIQAALNGGDAENVQGDSTLLLNNMTSASSHEIARVFGTDFVDKLGTMTVGLWEGPIRSGYGLHFVKIDEHTPVRRPTLKQVRSAVERDVLSDRSQQISEAFYMSLRERYTVRIESPEVDD